MAYSPRTRYELFYYLLIVYCIFIYRAYALFVIYLFIYLFYLFISLNESIQLSNNAERVNITRECSTDMYYVYVHVQYDICLHIDTVLGLISNFTKKISYRPTLVHVSYFIRS